MSRAVITMMALVTMMAAACAEAEPNAGGPCWGEVVNGLQVGIECPTAKVRFFELPVVRVTLRNACAGDLVLNCGVAVERARVPVSLHFLVTDAAGAERELTFVPWWSTQAKDDVRTLPPGGTCSDNAGLSWLKWARDPGRDSYGPLGVPLDLAPGKYKVAAVFDCRGPVHSPRPPGGTWTGRATSGAAEFEVLRPGATGTWSLPVKGLQARLLVDAPVREAGKVVNFVSHIELMNVSNAPISIREKDFDNVAVDLTDDEGRWVPPSAPQGLFTFGMTACWKRIEPGRSALLPAYFASYFKNARHEPEDGSKYFWPCLGWDLAPGRYKLVAGFSSEDWTRWGSAPPDAWSGSLWTPPAIVEARAAGKKE